MTQNISRPARSRARSGFVLLLALFHGLVYVFLVPPWQHYDEPNHFEYAWLTANRAGLPHPGDFDLSMRGQVAASMIANGFFSSGIPLPDLGAVDKPPWIGAYPQLDDPPLYYLLAGLPLRLLPESDIETQLFSARLVSLGFYLLNLLAAFGIGRTLFSPTNPLRWLGPLTLALLPGYTDLMTAVSNDAAAVAIFSFFIWGGISLIRHGFSWGRFSLTTGVALMCYWTKSVLVIVFPLLALALLLALIPTARRRWLWLALLGGGIAGLLGTLTWQDAAYWYRATAQAESTRFESPAAPVGTHALRLLAEAPTTPPWLKPLSQPLPIALVQDLAGGPVTLGAWMWANQPVQAFTPSLHTGGNRFHQTVTLGLEPAFFAFSVDLASEGFRAWVTLDPPDSPAAPELQIYYDGLVLAPGYRPVDEPPQFSDPDAQAGQWGGVPFTNLLRNGSGERVWPSFQPWADDLGTHLLPDQSRLSMILFSMFDPTAAGWYYQAAGARLFRTFWAKFGWGHVPLLGHKPYRWLMIISLIGIAGGALSLWRKRHVLSGDVLGWLFLLVLGIWGAALARGSIYIPLERVFLPVARYAYPAIIPTVFFLAFGWLEVLRDIGSRLHIPPTVQYGIYFAGFLSLDIASYLSIVRYYFER